MTSADTAIPDTTDKRRRNGDPDCVHCHGDSFFWRPNGEATRCDQCNSCCECYHGEPLVSDFSDLIDS